jgi:adenylate cyclase
MNAAPWFTSTHNTALTALYFYIPGGGGMVLFSLENLNDSFTLGPNKSYLINDSGDILYHAEYRFVQDGENVGAYNFTQNLWANKERNAQTLDKDEEGVRYFRAFYKLNTAGATVITSIEYDKVFEGIAAHTRSIIQLTAAVLFISILTIWFFAKSISEPLKTLASAAHTIEGGVFDLQLHSKSRDEVGVLTASFQRMCAALGIFGRFTNRDIALRAMRGEIKPGGLPKHATIFFSDIREFTAMSENFTSVFGDDASDRIVQWLNGYFTQMIECVEKTGGVVDKFIGDAVMAHWGTAYTSGSPEKDACNCIMAALMMREALYEMNKKRDPNDPGNPSIRIGCGINTGIVTAGQLGSDLRMEYTAIGDPVNLASRTETLNKPLGTDILITEDTWNLVKNKFITEEMPSVTVKGKEKPIRIFAVVNSVKTNKGPKTLAEVRELLVIKAPNIAKVNVNADEKKYKIGADR